MSGSQGSSAAPAAAPPPPRGLRRISQTQWIVISMVAGIVLGYLFPDHAPGENITITWTGSSGGSHSATVTLAAGPAV